MIAERLRMARTRLGWSREALAYHSGVSWSAIAQIESARRRNARPTTLAALARALGVTVDYLIGSDAPPTMLHHRATLYGSESEFIDAAVPFLKEGLERSEAILVVEPAANLDLLKEALGDQADEIKFAASEVWYPSPLAGASGYSEFIDEKLASGYGWVRLLGEFIVGNEDELSVWKSYESLFNVMFSRAPVTAMCTYKRSLGWLDDMVMETHPHLSENDGIVPNERYRAPEELLLG